MRVTPIVLIAYNRPEKIRNLINKLEQYKPENIIFAVDGPKPGRSDDASKVAEVQALADLFTWTTNVDLRFRDENLGLRAAVTDAVSYAVSTYGEAIVLEEDTLPGKNWIPFAETMLDRYRDQTAIEHISGYNLAPVEVQSQNGIGSRLSRYPESIAWATWGRAWDQFDGSLDWGLNATLTELVGIVGSYAGAVRWRQNFADANAGRISTWAYRWISSMWSRGSYVLSPNRNLVSYTGYDTGTNSFLRAPWTELELYEGSLALNIDGSVSLDAKADDWIGKNVFAETAFGVSRGVAISAALQIRKRIRERRLRLERLSKLS